MASKIRILVLCLLLGVALALLVQKKQYVIAQNNPFDNRPEVAVLFVGNSRTFYNDMPAMVRIIADSAHSKNKYRIEMYALPSKTLEDQWNDTKVHDLLQQKWDYVVFQGGSSEQINEHMQESFSTYGTKLVNLAKENSAMPVLFVAWRCLPDYYPQLRDISPQVFYYNIQSSYAQLAQSTGAASVNVGKAWEKLLAESSIQLYVDGNHPNMRGSYLAALMFYHYFSGDDLKNVTYIPEGITPEDAQILKTAAME